MIVENEKSLSVEEKEALDEAKISVNEFVSGTKKCILKVTDAR